MESKEKINKKKLTDYELEDREREKDRIKKEKKYFCNEMAKLLDISNIKGFCNYFDILEIEFMELIKDILNSNDRLIKNEKVYENEFKNNINRNFFSELKKINSNKDISVLEKRIVNLIYEDIENKIEIDYKNNLYIYQEEKLIKITDLENFKYEFLLNLEKLSNQFIQSSEIRRREIISKSPISLINELFFWNIRELFNLLKNEIERESNKKIKVYKFLLLYFHIFFIINEQESYIEILEIILNLKVSIPLEYKIDRYEKIDNTASFLRKIIYNKKNKRDNLFENKLKAIEVYYLTFSDDPEIINFLIKNKDKYFTADLIAAYYRGIYLSKIKYKGKNISAYFESYRKAEFILQVYERIEIKKLTQKDYDDLKDFYLTQKEKEGKFSDKKNKEFCRDEVSPYNVDIEENFVREIIKIGNKTKNIQTKWKELYSITKKYLEIKKVYGNFQDVTGIKRDIMILINYIYYVYFDANQFAGKKIKHKDLIIKLKDNEKNNIEFIKSLIDYRNLNNLIDNYILYNDIYK